MIPSTSLFDAICKIEELNWSTAIKFAVPSDDVDLEAKHAAGMVKSADGELWQKLPLSRFEIKDVTFIRWCIIDYASSQHHMSVLEICDCKLDYILRQTSHYVLYDFFTSIQVRVLYNMLSLKRWKAEKWWVYLNGELVFEIEFRRLESFALIISKLVSEESSSKFLAVNDCEHHRRPKLYSHLYPANSSLVHPPSQNLQF